MTAVVAVALGAIALLVGWLGVSDSLLTTEQLPYVISGGLGGVFLLGLGAIFWLSADLRDEWRELHDIAEKLRDDEAPSDERAAVSTSDLPDTSETEGSLNGGESPLPADRRTRRRAGAAGS